MDDKDIQEQLTKLAGWVKVGEGIQKDFNFANFMESMSFVNKIAPLAEEMGHHPDLKIEYSKVTVTLSTRDQGGVTDKDLELAANIDGLK